MSIRQDYASEQEMLQSLADLEISNTQIEPITNEKAEINKRENNDMRIETPLPATAAEQAFDDLVRKYTPEELSDAGSLAGREFKETTILLVKEYLLSQAEYPIFLEKIKTPEKNSKEISTLIAALRNNLPNNPRLYQIYNSIIKSSMNIIPLEIRTQEQLEAYRPQLRIGNEWTDDLKLHGPKNYEYNLKYLYHWTLKENLPLIEENGLLPNLITAKGRSSYIYTAYQERNDWWADIQKEYFENKDVEKDKFVELRIRYDPRQITAYIDLPGNKNSGFPVFELISSDLISLDQLVGINYAKDMRLIALEKHKHKGEFTELCAKVPEIIEVYKTAPQKNKGSFTQWVNSWDTIRSYPDIVAAYHRLWKYSPFHKTYVPPSAWDKLLCYPPNEFDEIRLDFVPPNLIEVL